MLKKVLIIVGIVVAIIVGLGVYGVYYFQPNEHTVLDFIKENPERTAIKLVVNDTLFAEQNANTVMPLASTVKIIIAIEYAEQAANGLIDADKLIPIAALNKFYVPKTDGGAHPNWLKSVDGKIQDNKISIREIAKGMIRYSSNANTEWLSNFLGLGNINSRLDSLGIQQHEEIYYIVSALFVGKEAFPNLKGSALEEKLRSMSLSNYITTTKSIHQKLLADTTYKKNLGDLSMNIQHVWSDNLTGSTVAEYVGIMEKMNSRTYFSPETHEYLNEVMESIMENPANQEWLAHSGMKGGSTAFVLTKSLYATDKKGNKITLAYFFDDLNAVESMRLKMSMNEFELKILSKPTFRKKVKDTLQ